MARHYQLHPNYKAFTGILGGVYPCRNGVVSIPDREDGKRPRPLIEHYGAKQIESPEKAVWPEIKKEEPKK